MRRLTTRNVVLAAGAAVLMLASSSCKPNAEGSGEAVAGSLMSTVHMADPKAAGQLLRGFYPVEGNAWRWTAGKFAVALRPPAGAAQSGAKLVARFTIPESSLARIKSMTLSASVGGLALPPETYKKAGEYTYTRDVAATALSGGKVVVEFALDNYLPAGTVEARELGVVAGSIEFEPAR
jgi:hypothetical protein